MKKLIRIAVPLMLILPSLVAAQNVPNPPATDVSGIFNLLCTIFGWAFTLFIIVAVILVLYAAFLYLTAGGDTTKVSIANKTLIYAAVAVIVAILARAFPSIISSLVGGGALTAC